MGKKREEAVRLLKGTKEAEATASEPHGLCPQAHGNQLLNM